MTFNLIQRAWIPVCSSEGERRWVAPADIVDLPDDFDIEWGRPEFRIATYELLIGIFAVALAARLRESEDWVALAETPPMRSELEALLAPLIPHFDLDGAGPRFLQDFDELKGEARPLDALLLDAPGDNTLKNGADIFAKRDRFPIFSRKAAAIALYAMQAFATSGGPGHRTSMRGGGPLTTLIVPERPSLWRRIAVNLPFLGDDPQKRPPDDPGLIFPWLKPTRVSKNDMITQMGLHAHYLQCFFGMPRRIRLIFAPNDGCAPCAITGEIDDIVTFGLSMLPHGIRYGVWRHPLSPYYRAKPGEPPLPAHAQNGRAGYRDWAGYLFRKGDDDLRAEQIMNFEHTFRRQRHARLVAAGFVTSSYTCLDWTESEAPLFLLENAKARRRLAEIVQEQFVPAAEIAADALRRALRRALAIEDGQKTTVASAVERFWIDTGDAFFRLIGEAHEKLSAASDEDDLNELDLSSLSQCWLAELKRRALEIFRKTTPVDQLSRLDSNSVERIANAAKSLGLCLSGYSKDGGELYAKLGLPVPEKKAA
ncbi:MAG: type I-E CRISPR-associated protein Cse1/CasA [Beijerinckiaceae bacterium]